MYLPQQRRQVLMQEYPEAIFIFLAGKEMLRNEDVYFPFRQNSYFYYLTHITDPHLILMLYQNTSILFMPASDPIENLWNGPRLTEQEALEIYKIDKVFDISMFSEILTSYLSEVKTIFYTLGLHLEYDNVLLKVLNARKGKMRFFMPTIKDPREYIAEKRKIKDISEIATLQKACALSAQAHNQAIAFTKPGLYEWEIQAKLEYSFFQAGAQRLGYNSIIAGGKNATILHYTKNNQRLKASDLLLVDAAAELDYYTADITRTFPVGNRFNKAQKEIYQIVLTAQKKAIQQAQPGNTLLHIHQTACEWLKEGLCQLKICAPHTIEKFFSHFYPHKTSHWLGLDVHDPGKYFDSTPILLQPGMVFTVEPGLYFTPHPEFSIPPDYLGIGIRIEDDILITNTGHQNLTELAVKEIEAIEDLKNATWSH